MTTNLSSDASRYAQVAGDRVNLSAAYHDFSAAQAVVRDLERAGLRPTVIVPLGPSSETPPPPASAPALLENPRPTSAVGALMLGAVTGLATLIWLDGRHWVLYVGIGLLVGALTGWIASALAATAHPAREEDLLAYPGGAMTVEIETEEPMTARLAETVMAGHSPAIFTSRTKPPARPPEERVMWQHEGGLSPLEVLGSWLEESRPRPSLARRGRHLQPDRLRL